MCPGISAFGNIGFRYKVDTPICTSLIDVASAALGRDLRLEGGTVERLGKDNLERILQEMSACVYV